ncbi:MAG: ATP-binding protein [Desulfococcaceae bacterium]
MTTISIASGKGGTGKTTVAVSLALSRSGGQLLDCDVEAPNAHLFLHPKIEFSEPVYTPVPLVDEDRCTLCGACADLCQFKAIAVLPEAILTFPELCHGCGGCMAVCPEGVIQETGRELGVVERGRRGDLAFLHGRMRVGEAMAPPLIKKVREAAAPDLDTVIDAPPGASCPVMAAIHGTDVVVLVTEPTPFGLNDLELAVGAVRTLNIPHGIVINRADLGDRRVWEFADREEIPILLEIPFDREIAEAYSRGDALVAARPEYLEKFQELGERAEALARGGVR